jgi:hypothetical protein
MIKFEENEMFFTVLGQITALIPQNFPQLNHNKPEINRYDTERGAARKHCHNRHVTI